ncbi:hypothetical protein MBBAR_10c00780 [Methanobrevibacter arboriphilus JCM 13429 = DSM 1125]|uniref:Uncharacterized protein n=1 Tax=Methanobrevibacter arboriphilus JCM 13429 = DSM 1125 TaxID=1300164 RepID=A0A1V6N294_METAZ|nr:hypothetical protein [Methanobrevibacter arboriphilus]OQD58737.1 hypothetical protein MBBAR_10c00780 [Methanobrevibacter arboriphilus JCM 13429 = DSM 1125]
MNQITTTNNGLSELNSKGIVTIDTILFPKSIDDEIHNNELLANVFAKVIENNSYFSEIPVKHKDKKTGKYIKEIKKWVNISGWSFIDRVLKITPHIIKIERKIVKKGKQEIIQHCSTCELRTLKGQVIATGIGKASSNEKFKDGWSESKLESLSQSRSISKTHRLYFQDILEKLNLNNDFIIEADFVEKSPKDPENATELIDKHSEMMKKHSFKSDEEIDKNTEKLKNELEKSREEAKKKENRKGPVITGSFTKKEDEKTIAEKAIEDSEKRKKEKESSDFKKVNEVEKTNDLVDDPGARQFIKDIILDIGSNSEAMIKKEIADMVKNPDSGVTMKEATRAIKELERHGVPV